MKTKSFNRNDILSVLTMVSILFYSGFYRTMNINAMIYSVLLTTLIIILISIFEKNILLSLFYLMMIVFMINMPLIDSFKNPGWFDNYDLFILRSTINNIYISLISIHFGFYYLNKIFSYSHDRDLFLYNHDENYKIKLNNIKNKLSNKIKTFRINKYLNFNILLFLTYLIIFIVKGYTELDKYFFMKGKVYEDFYKEYVITYPSIIRVISNLYIYSFTFFLALNPKKKYATVSLILNTILTIPMLIIGKRSPFILSIIFFVVYYLIRNKEGEIWVSKRSILIFCVSVPIIVVMMTLINYSRSGFQTHGIKVIDYIIDFMYRQGFTFHVNYLGVKYSESIFMNSGPKNYIFGEIIDLIKFGRLSQLFFNADPLPLGNSLFASLNSYNYAHALSSLAHPKYFEGHGYGSSFVLEAFQTYGTIGVFFVSCAIGYLFKKIPYFLEKNIWTRFFSLIILEKIYFIPRSAFSSIFSFVFKPTFIFMLTFYMCLYYLSPKKKSNFIKN